jgi:hypothetical protein
MDEAQHYREQAVELRKIADSTSDDTTRKSLLKNVTSCEQMALALDKVARDQLKTSKHLGEHHGLL